MKYLAKISFVLLLVFIIAAWAIKEPRVLIIGDSISLGYTPFIKTHFSGKVVIEHNPGNAQHTGTGLNKVKEWVSNRDWDIVQFNWGLWDLCYRHTDSKVQGHRDKINGEITFTVDQYRTNLDSIVSILTKTTDAKLIFVTTSYVPEMEAGRFSEDALKYNAVAKEVMRKHNVDINDIYTESIAIHRQYGVGPDDVHYTQEGYKALSTLIIDYLSEKIE